MQEIEWRDRAFSQKSLTNQTTLTVKDELVCDGAAYHTWAREQGAAGAVAPPTLRLGATPQLWQKNAL